MKRIGLNTSFKKLLLLIHQERNCLFFWSCHFTFFSSCGASSFLLGTSNHVLRRERWNPGCTLEINSLEYFYNLVFWNVPNSFSTSVPFASAPFWGLESCENSLKFREHWICCFMIRNCETDLNVSVREHAKEGTY